MKKLLRTDSIAELAKFWDTHDLTEFEAELEVVDGKVFGRRAKAVVSVPFLAKEKAAVRRIARARGVREAELVREWVLERLHTS